MARNDTTSAVIDTTLRVMVGTSVLATGLLMPGLISVLEEPTYDLFKHLDKRARERELRRVIKYMIDRGLIRGEYEHGMTISKKGLTRLKANQAKNISISLPDVWDGRWRMVVYDIPEAQKRARDIVSKKLRELSFWQLQRSVWISPFSCRDEIILLSASYNVNKFVSYIETDHLDNQKILIKRFKKKFPSIKF